VTVLLAADAVEVSRMTKNGLRRFDARGALVSARVVADDPAIHADQRAAQALDGPCAILQVVVRHQAPAVRPDDVLAALRETSGLTPPVAPSVTRLAQGPLDAQTGSLGDPLAPDRSAPVVDAPPPSPAGA
jgi:hypothetical protein